MPAMFVLHERKMKTTHDEFMRAVAVEISCLVDGKSRIPMVTDYEKGFVEAIDENLPNV